MLGGETTEHFETLIIGAGQSGLSVGYHLARLGRPFVIVDARDRIGAVWRERWDSLRLFTPARFDGLDGMPFPAPPHYFPTKNEMADYLEAYAARFDLPVRCGVRVDRLTRAGGRFVASAGERRFAADHVVVAMSDFQEPRVPAFADRLDPAIVQLHSCDYRNPGQLRAGPVLLVGAGNSAAELAAELAPHHTVSLSGRDTGQIPFRVEGRAARLGMTRLFLRGLFHSVLTVRTPLGRKVRRKVLHQGGPLIRVRTEDLARQGVERVPRTTGVHEGRPVLEDGRVLDVTNVVWCTGFHAGLDWIDLPVHGPREPLHRSGVVDSEPGLYFVGLFFLHALSSTMIHGVGRDAKRVATAIAREVTARRGQSSDRDRGASADRQVAQL
jgi:putative flavoprotein involved in K+ transport